MKATNPSFMPALVIDSTACNLVMTWTCIHDTRAEEYTKTSNGWFALIKIPTRTGNMMTVCGVLDWEAGMDLPGMFNSQIKEFQAQASMDQEAKCNILQRAPCLLADPIHLLIMWCCSGNDDIDNFWDMVQLESAQLT